MSKTEEESDEIHSFTDARLYTQATSGFYGAFFCRGFNYLKQIYQYLIELFQAKIYPSLIICLF